MMLSVVNDKRQLQIIASSVFCDARKAKNVRRKARLGYNTRFSYECVPVPYPYDRDTCIPSNEYFESLDHNLPTHNFSVVLGGVIKYHKPNLNLFVHQKHK